MKVFEKAEPELAEVATDNSINKGTREHKIFFASSKCSGITLTNNEIKYII